MPKNLLSEYNRQLSRLKRAALTRSKQSGGEIKIPRRPQRITPASVRKITAAADRVIRENRSFGQVQRRRMPGVTAEEIRSGVQPLRPGRPRKPKRPKPTGSATPESRKYPGGIEYKTHPKERKPRITDEERKRPKKKLKYVYENGITYVFDPETGELLREFETQKRPFSSRRRRVKNPVQKKSSKQKVKYVRRDGRTYVVDAETGEVLREYETKKLKYVHQDGRTYVFDPETGELLRDFETKHRKRKPVTDEDEETEEDEDEQGEIAGGTMPEDDYALTLVYALLSEISDIPGAAGDWVKLAKKLIEETIDSDGLIAVGRRLLQAHETGVERVQLIVRYDDGTLSGDNKCSFLFEGLYKLITGDGFVPMSYWNDNIRPIYDR